MSSFGTKMLGSLTRENLHLHHVKDEESDCWIWNKAINPSGYGVKSRGRREEGNEYAHRLVWILFNGSIPEGVHILHTCDNPPCVNPKHLFSGTQGDNNRDCMRKGRTKFGVYSRGTRWNESI